MIFGLILAENFIFFKLETKNLNVRSTFKTVLFNIYIKKGKKVTGAFSEKLLWKIKSSLS